MTHQTSSDDAFFLPDGDSYLPQPICRGPWDPGSLNGRVVAGLLGAVVEERHGEAGWLPVRMTVDMFRLPRFDPVVIGAKMQCVDGDDPNKKVQVDTIGIVTLTRWRAAQLAE